MALTELPGTSDFLTDAAYLLRITAPETSAHLMSQRNSLLSLRGIPSTETQRQHVCDGCGHIMILGQGTKLWLEKRKTALKKKKKKPPTKRGSGSDPKTTTTTPSPPVKVIHCGKCSQDTRIQLPLPGQATRTRIAIKSKVKKTAAAEETPPSKTANASSKKRAKNRKAGLQALLLGQQQNSSNPLNLASFMK